MQQDSVGVAILSRILRSLLIRRIAAEKRQLGPSIAQAEASTVADDSQGCHLGYQRGEIEDPRSTCSEASQMRIVFGQESEESQGIRVASMKKDTGD